MTVKLLKINKKYQEKKFLYLFEDNNLGAELLKQIKENNIFYKVKKSIFIKKIEEKYSNVNLKEEFSKKQVFFLEANNILSNEKLDQITNIKEYRYQKLNSPVKYDILIKAGLTGLRQNEKLKSLDSFNALNIEKGMVVIKKDFIVLRTNEKISSVLSKTFEYLKLKVKECSVILIGVLLKDVFLNKNQLEKYFSVKSSTQFLSLNNTILLKLGLPNSYTLKTIIIKNLMLLRLILKIINNRGANKI